jgi:hypothetical protein
MNADATTKPVATKELTKRDASSAMAKELGYKG